MSSLPSSKSITGIKSNTLNSKLRMALNPRFHGDYSFEAKLKNCDVPIKFVVIFGKWNKDDDNKYHILITNNLRSSAKTVVTNYLLRWGIEHRFKQVSPFKSPLKKGDSGGCVFSKFPVSTRTSLQPP